jgi:hypothetical protein
MNINELDTRVDEIERQLLRDDPSLDRQFARLDPANRRHDVTVFAMLVSSAAFLMIGLATMSIVAWLVGVVAFVASLSVDTRLERELRAIRRSSSARPRPSSR